MVAVRLVEDYTNTMDIVYFGILLVVLVAGLYYIAQILRKNTGEKEDSQSLLLLQNQLQELNRTLDNKLSDSNRTLQSQFGHSARIIADVTEKLTKLEETNKQVLTFSDQLERLRDILQNPKQRGVFGEYYLETLLKNAFSPKEYQMQYKFKDGEIVDAALFWGDKVIPIDSKFSLENYNRIVEERDPVERETLEKLFKQDLKMRIDETAKYIRPNEGTTEFAFMFIPAEGIYYDLLVNKVGAIKVNTRDLLEYAAREKKVHIVSPTTFYASLQIMLEGMRNYQIQESTKDILKKVGTLSRHLKAYNDYFMKVGTHLGTTVNAYVSANKEFSKIEKDVLKLGGEAIGVEMQQLTGPRSTDEE